MSDPRDAFDRAEDMFTQQYNEGFLSLDEFNAEMRELGRDYAQMAEEAAWDAYEAERDRW